MADHIENLRSVIRNLREKLWWKVGYSPSHEREWETEDQSQEREERNRKERAEWDKETERLCSGETDGNL